MCGSELSRGTFASRIVLRPAELSASRLRVPHQHRPQRLLLLLLDSNADTECYTDSDGYSYGDADGYTDNYAKAHAHAKARTDAKASSVTAAETVSGSLPLSDERLLHGRNSGRRTQFVWSDY